MNIEPPNWKKLGLVPDCLAKLQTLHALGITEIPPEGWSDTLVINRNGTFFHGKSGLIVRKGFTTYYEDPKQALKAYRLVKGTPTGDLARAWMTGRGLL